MGEGACRQVAPVGQAAGEPGARYVIAKVLHGSFRRLEPTQFFIGAQGAPTMPMPDDAEKGVVGSVYVLGLHGRGTRAG